MADAHKPASAAPAAGNSDLVFFILKIVVILLVVVMAVAFMLRDPASALSFISFLHFVQVFGILVIAVSVITAFFMMHRFTPLNIALGQGYGDKYKSPTEKNMNTTQYSARLSQVDEHLNSNSEAEWKLAIIELDGLLRDVLKENGYVAETVAEQLKGAETRPFATLQNAWDAHKVRNRIAHDGVSFTMDKHEAKRVYSLYKSVFEEFKII
jgi:hypothetical protein